MITPILYMVPDNSDVQKVEITSLFTEPVFTRKQPGAHIADPPAQ
jgi:hypothetical protein